QDRAVAGKVVAACAAAIVTARSGKHWIPLIEHVADAVPAVAAVLTPELRTKMVRLKASFGKLHPCHAYHRHMVSALHPWLSFWLLAKAPAGLAPHQPLS